MPVTSPSMSPTTGRVSVELDVLMLHRQLVDAAVGRRDPAGHLARLDHALLQRMDEAAVRVGGDPPGQLFLVLLLRNEIALRVHRQSRPSADRATEARGGQRQAHTES